MNISLFQKINAAALPVKNTTIEDAIKTIKTNPENDLISFARYIGKKVEVGDTVYLDFDHIQDKLYYNAYVLDRTKALCYDENKKLTIFTYKDISEKDKARYGIENIKIIKINDFIDFFSDKTDAGLISLVYNFKSKSFDPKIHNIYEYIKIEKTTCITWNASFKGARKKENIESLSSYIYFDIDSYDGSIDDILNILKNPKIKPIKAIWRSFGGDGIGFLVGVEDLNENNFLSTWRYFEKLFLDNFNIIVDKATKDITRINVLSYDKDIYVNEHFEPMLAVEPEIFTYENPREVDININKVEVKENIDEIMNYIISSSIENGIHFNKKENRFSYTFYQRLFALTNLYGIEIEIVWDFLKRTTQDNPLILDNKKYSESEIYDIAERQYDYYITQFGTVAYNFNKEDNLYEIVEQNVPYSGDIDLKIKSIKKLNKNNYERIVRSAKKTGIEISELLKFFDNNINLNVGGTKNTLHGLIHDIYANDSIPFGIKYRLTEEGKKIKRDRYIAENFDKECIDYTKKLKGAVQNYFLNIVKTQNFTFNSENINSFAFKFFRQALSFAIPKDRAYELFVKKVNYHSAARYGKFYAEEIYDKYSHTFGLRFVEKSVVKSDMEYDEIISLEVDKLSNSDFKTTKDTILIADTNIGKTTWASTNNPDEKRVILVPTVGALKSIVQKYKASAFYENEKNVKEGDKIIVSTYSSYTNLYSVLRNFESKGSDYVLYMDECHNLAVSTNKKFRNKELNFLMDNMKLFKRRVFMTGTYFPVMHPNLKKFKKVLIKKAVQEKKNAKIVPYTDKHKSLLKNLKKGEKNIIYLQNKQMDKELGRLISYLKNNGWERIYCLNSDQKNSDYFKKLISNEILPEDAEIIITTSITIEALNILDIDIKSVHFLTFENPRLMEQMVNRMRKVLPENIYIYISNKYLFEPRVKSFDIIKTQEELQDKSQLLLNTFFPSKRMVDSSNLSNAMFNNLLFKDKILFRETRKRLDIDYLAIANYVYEQETLLCKTNIQYMEKLLGQYNWSLTIDNEDKEKRTRKEIKQIKESIKPIIENIIESHSLILNEMEGLESPDEVIKERYDNHHYKFKKDEKDFYLMYLKLRNYVESKDAISLIRKISTENIKDGSIQKIRKSFNKVIRQLIIKANKIKDTSFSLPIDMASGFSKKMFEFYDDCKVNGNMSITKNKMIELFNDFKTYDEKYLKLDGKKYALRAFSKYFSLTLHEDLKDNDKNIYVLNQPYITNFVAVFAKRLQDWASNRLNTHLKLSFVREEIEKMKKDLGIFSVLDYKDKDVIVDLLSDFFELRVYKNNTFQILELSPVILNNIKIKE